MIGYGVGGNSPSAMCRSVPQMPHAPTCTTSSPCPGTGSATSVTFSSPGFSHTTARIMPPHRSPEGPYSPRGAGPSFADPQPGGAVEQVQVRGVHLDLDDLAWTGVVAGRPDDDLAAGVARQVPVDIGVAAQV